MTPLEEKLLEYTQKLDDKGPIIVQQMLDYIQAKCWFQITVGFILIPVLLYSLYIIQNAEKYFNKSPLPVFGSVIGLIFGVLGCFAIIEGFYTLWCASNYPDLFILKQLQ